MTSHSDGEAKMVRQMKIRHQFEGGAGLLLEEWGYLRSLKRARRLSGVPLIQTYDTATHCYYVGILFEQVAMMESVRITSGEISFVYRHDVLEAVTGDLLLPVKLLAPDEWRQVEQKILQVHPCLQSLSDEWAEKHFSPDAWRLFKTCDLLELLLFCREEVELGNSSQAVRNVIENCCDILSSCGFPYVVSLLR